MENQDRIDRAKKWLEKGEREFQKKNFKKAIKSLKKSVDLDSSNKVAWHNLGIAYYNTRKYFNARNCVNKALEIDPDYENAKDSMKTIEQKSDFGETCYVCGDKGELDCDWCKRTICDGHWRAIRRRPFTLTDIGVPMVCLKCKEKHKYMMIIALLGIAAIFIVVIAIFYLWFCTFI